MAHIVLTGHIVVPMDELDTVTDALEVHKRLTRAEPGCLIFNVQPDPDRLGWFKIYEKFSSQKAFDAHRARVATSEWREISKNVERHYEIKEIQTGEQTT